MAASRLFFGGKNAEAGAYWPHRAKQLLAASGAFGFPQAMATTGFFAILLLSVSVAAEQVPRYVEQV